MDLCFGNMYVGNIIADDQCCCRKSEYLVLSPNYLAENLSMPFRETSQPGLLLSAQTLHMALERSLPQCAD